MLIPGVIMVVRLLNTSLSKTPGVGGAVVFVFNYKCEIQRSIQAGIAQLLVCWARCSA